MDIKPLPWLTKRMSLFVFSIILTLQTSIHGTTRTLVIPFAVADIEYKIFFEKMC